MLLGGWLERGEGGIRRGWVRTFVSLRRNWLGVLLSGWLLCSGAGCRRGQLLFLKRASGWTRSCWRLELRLRSNGRGGGRSLNSPGLGGCDFFPGWARDLRSGWQTGESTVIATTTVIFMSSGGRILIGHCGGVWCWAEGIPTQLRYNTPTADSKPSSLYERQPKQANLSKEKKSNLDIDSKIKGGYSRNCRRISTQCGNDCCHQLLGYGADREVERKSIVDRRGP